MDKKNIKRKQVEGPSLKDLGYDIKKDIKVKRKKKSIYNIMLLTVMILCVFFLTLYVFSPKITLNGSCTIKISYQENYEELGAKAKFFNVDLTDKIKIKSNVTDNKVGNYKVKYTVKYLFLTVSKIRNVKIIDEVKPTITLEGDTDTNICPGGTYQEIGYTAYDDYDKDITDKVTIKKDKNKWIYTVKDSSNNSNTVTRNIIELDNTNPEITLKGTETIYLSLEEEFIEPGYIASDNCSGDITNKVKVTGSVTSKKDGTYTLKYEVSDDSGNTSTVERKVIVAAKTDPNSGEIKLGTIYLTFDDGPSNTTTATILDILKEEGVKATFFVTNSGSDSLIKRMYDEGHTVALHTASHNYAKVYQSDDAYFSDLKTVSDRVKRITGQTSKIVRFPGGSSNTVSKKYNIGIMSRLTKSLLNQGYRYYDWNIDSQDAYNAKTSSQVYKNVTSNLSKNKANIVLMHDIKTQTRDALRDIIKYGKENGYTFDRIDMNTHMVRQKVNN